MGAVWARAEDACTPRSDEPDGVRFRPFAQASKANIASHIHLSRLSLSPHATRPALLLLLAMLTAVCYMLQIRRALLRADLVNPIQQLVNIVSQSRVHHLGRRRLGAQLLCDCLVLRLQFRELLQLFCL